MLLEDRSRYILRSIVHAAPFVMVMACGVFYVAMKESALLPFRDVVSDTMLSSFALWWSYMIWQWRPGYAYLVLVFFLGFCAVVIVRTSSQALPLVLQHASLWMILYFLPLWVLTSWLRGRDFLPPAKSPQPLPRESNPTDKAVLKWFVAFAPLLVLSSGGGLFYTAQLGGWMSLTLVLTGSFYGILSLELSYLWWKKSSGVMILLVPIVCFANALGSVIPLSEEPLRALLQVQRFSLKVFVFFLLLWCLKPHLKKKGLIPE